MGRLWAADAERRGQKSTLSSREDICNVGLSRLSTWNLQKNRKLNWMMTAVATQKSHCVELTGIMGLKIWQTTDISHYGCRCTWLWRSRNKSHTSSVRLPWTSGSPLQQVVLSIAVRARKKTTHHDSPACAALTGFSPLTTSLYSGHSARLSPLGFLALLIYTSLQATFTVRTVQLYFQAH